MIELIWDIVQQRQISDARAEANDAKHTHCIYCGAAVPRQHLYE